MSVLGRFRARRQAAVVAEKERCSFCPQPYVVVTSRPIYDDPDGLPATETIRRCLDHPPDWADTKSQCGTCGRAFWPDFLHLDCGDEEVQGAVDSSG